MRKFGKRYYARLNRRPIHTSRARLLAHLIRRNGYNARVIPASQGAHRGSRIYFAKRDDSFFKQPDSPFDNTVMSGRQLNSNIRPKIPSIMSEKRNEMIESLTEGVAEGQTWDWEYLEYLDPFQTDAEQKFGSSSLYQLESKVNSGEITADDIRELFESYTTEDLEALVGGAQNYASYRNTEEYVSNIYSPLVEMALDWGEPNKYDGYNKPEPITGADFLDLALQSANWRYDKFKEFAKNQKSVEGRFSELKKENLEYFANEDLDLYEFLDEGNNLLIPMKAIFVTDGNGERKLWRMKFNTSEAHSMLESFRKGEGGLREQELLKLELEFFSRMGGSVSEIDQSLNIFYPGDSEDDFKRFTFLDYAEQQDDMSDEYFYNLLMDIPYEIEQADGAFWEVKNIYGVIGSGKKGYYDPKLTAYFEPSAGDSTVFQQMPDFIKYYHDPEYRQPLEVMGSGKFGIDAIDNPFTGEQEFDPFWERNGDGWTMGNDGKPIFDKEVREWPLAGTQSLIWRDHVLLDNPYGRFSGRTVQALQALFPNGMNQPAVGIQEIIQKIRNDGWEDDPMIVLSYLTGQAVNEITSEEFEALQNYGVVSKYGDPNNIFSGKRNIRTNETPQEWWGTMEMENMPGTWEEIFEDSPRRFNFQRHKMYDPMTGKQYVAEKKEDHERMSKLGYTHTPPKPYANSDKPISVAFMDSEKSDKKMKAVFTYADGHQKTTHFGGKGYSDYTIHKNSKRKQRYLDRHERNEDWGDPTSAGALSRWVLWNKKSKKASIDDYKRRFDLNG